MSRAGLLWAIGAFLSLAAVGVFVLAELTVRACNAKSEVALCAGPNEWWLRVAFLAATLFLITGLVRVARR